MVLATSQSYNSDNQTEMEINLWFKVTWYAAAQYIWMKILQIGVKNNVTFVLQQQVCNVLC